MLKYFRIMIFENPTI